MGARCSTGAIPNENSPITQQDKRLVRNTWSKLYKTWDSEHGTAFFMRLFSNHPNIKSAFKLFGGLSDEELATSHVFRAHVMVFGRTLDTWVSQLDDTDTLVALVQKSTESHVIRGVKDAQMFKDALSELLAYANEKFNLNQAQTDAWTHLATVVGNIIQQRIQDING